MRFLPYFRGLWKTKALIFVPVVSLLLTAVTLACKVVDDSFFQELLEEQVESGLLSVEESKKKCRWRKNELKVSYEYQVNAS